MDTLPKYEQYGPGYQGLEAHRFPDWHRSRLSAQTRTEANRIVDKKAKTAIILGLITGAFVLRVALAGQQSAYMDEGTFVLTGRTLIEKHSEYLDALSWTYGSYLWSIVAGLADMVGGIIGVRIVTALLGVVMVVGTAFTALGLAPEGLSQTRKWTVAGIAGLCMALFPTPVALGRFGTYDSLAGAGFMSGFALLVFSLKKWSAPKLLGAAALFFVAFLSKYLVAIYFPFICLYLIISPRSVKGAIRNIAWFVLPLSVLCGLYFLLFKDSLFNLLSYASGYSDLKSPNPAQQYLYDHPELLVLAGFAIFGLWKATRTGRLIALGGSGVILAFQLTARADYDFWKHSIYLIFFLSPLAALILAPVVQFILASLFRKPRKDQWLSTVIKFGLLGLVLFWGISQTIEQSTKLVTFYPNLKDSVSAIRQQAAGAKWILVDDSAVRYYLYPELQHDNIADPFGINYKGITGLDAYRAAITDRAYDALILDGGIGPVGRQIRDQLDDVIQNYYQLVYSKPANSGTVVEIYKPRQGTVQPVQEPSPTQSKIWDFKTGTERWGGKPETGDLQPGLQVSISRDHTWQGHATLQFSVTQNVSIVGVKRVGNISKIRAQVFIVPAEWDNTAVRVGMIGFDSDWNWHDDGFKQIVRAGQWTEVTWDLTQPGMYNQIGLKFVAPPNTTVYIGQVEVTP